MSIKVNHIMTKIGTHYVTHKKKGEKTTLYNT